MTIHSGLDPDLRNPSTIWRRLLSFFFVCFELVFSIRRRRSRERASRSSLLRSSRIASAPIPALNRRPNSFSAFWYSSSLRSFFFGRSVSPGLVTM